MTSGWSASVRARPTRLRMPPERSLGRIALDSRQPDELERLRDAPEDLVLAHLVPELLAQAVRDVLADVERVEERRTLEEVRDATPDLDEVALGDLRHVDVVEEDSPRVDREQADQHLEHDALADARRAHHRDDLAAFHLEREVGVDDLRTERLLDVAELDERPCRIPSKA